MTLTRFIIWGIPILSIFGGSVSATLDLNNNLISDVWESLYPEAMVDGSADADFDGLTNREEALIRTNPLDAGSGFDLSVSPTTGLNADSHLLLKWHSEEGLSYSVRFADEVANLSDQDVVPENHLGNGGLEEVEVEKSAVTGENRFWQVSTDGSAMDTDGDLLDTWEEVRLGSDPTLRDSDTDGISDGKDFAYLAGPTVFSPAGLGVPSTGPLAGKLIRYQSDGNQVAVRAFGVNYFDGFLRYIRDEEDRSFESGFEYLSDINIPVARVLLGGFWPADWNLYFSDKDEYYRRLDDFVNQAEQNEVGLIPVLFWHFATVGDVVQDAVDAGYIVPNVNAADTASDYDFVPPSPLNVDKDGNPTYDEFRGAMARSTSGTRALITYVTEEVVNRYKGSPAIWGWEFANELNLGVDLPNPTLNRPVVRPVQQKNLSRDGSDVASYESDDDLMRADIKIAKEHFASTVRALDPWRFISSGDSRPRAAAYNNWQTQTWGIGSRSELAQVLPIDNPSGYDSVSIHFYANEENYFLDAPQVSLNFESGTNQGEELTDYKNFLNFFMTESAALGKPLFVGEWGAGGDGTTQAEKDTFHSFMQALIDTDVQLSLLWTFDNQNAGQAAIWWVNPDTDKEFQLTNDDPDLWDLEQANSTYGVW